ncbi:hypothetical protein CR513_13500, partial [Mucuna pruriens]
MAATMKCISAISAISVYFLVCLSKVQSELLSNAIVPPRGWNSYDSFSWIISEEEFLQNANIMSQQLRTGGYRYAVVDFLWYRSLKGDLNSLGFDSIDQWGRMIPDPERWPSSTGWQGFIDVANKLHSMGLYFGIHLMAGISTQAFNKNTPILDSKTGSAYMESGRAWYAKDIGIPSRPCKWMTNGFMAINTTMGAGKAFLRSIYELYAFWGVDFVKLDCVFGDDLDLDEIKSVSEILNDINQNVVFSVSPGVHATPAMAKMVSGLVNTYRVTGDFWDSWSAILANFDVARDFAASNLIGVNGSNGQSWLDLDMLPFGYLTNPGAREGPHRFTNLTQDEQRTQVNMHKHTTEFELILISQLTLWSMAKSPIIYGGDLRKIDAWTLDLITNPTLKEINSFSSNNQEAYVKTEGHNVAEWDPKEIRSWVATGRKGVIYVAFFNLIEEKTTISANIANIASVLPGKRILTHCAGTETWTRRVIQTNNTFSLEVSSHGCAVSLQNAIVPPRGWNSYDCFNWIVSEEEYLQNANIISKRLLSHGYQYAVVDYLWYRSLKGDPNSIGLDMIDQWGRMVPDPERWPSSRGGRGFSDVANKVHSMGLKFGIHLMAGISTQAFNKNTPILDTKTRQPYMESGRAWNAKDIGIPSKACKWMKNGFMALNARTGAGQAFLRSIYELYASWGVDFVKLDCVFGDDLDLDEITSVSKILNGLNNPIVLSLSPGLYATPQMAKTVSSLVNTYRVTEDDWDMWPDLVPHFNVARDIAASNLIGINGLRGKSWPDLDMLPFGWLTEEGVHEGPHRFTKLTQDEQRTQFPHITLLNDVKTEGHNVTKVSSTDSLAFTECTDPKASGWSSEKNNQDLERICHKNPTQDQGEPFCLHKGELPIASSKHTSTESEHTWELKSNGTLVNGHSGMCAVVKHVQAEGYPNGIRSWIATGRNGETYVAFFNLNNEQTTISANIVDLAIVHPGKGKLRLCAGTETWSGRTIKANNTFSANIPSHGC